MQNAEILDWVSLGEERDFSELYKFQFEFLAHNVPFFRRHYAHIKLSSGLKDETLIQAVPRMMKGDLRAASSRSFLSDKNIPALDSIVIHRASGGTTGRATGAFYSRRDWQAAIDLHVLAFKNSFMEVGEQVIAYNCYHQGHISGPIFNDVVANLGAIPLSRHFGATDEDVLEEIIWNRCNAIIAPATSTKKGGTLEALLEIDAARGRNYINGDNIKLLIVSSTELTEALLEELKALGITNILNCYGSTESMPVAISCPHRPLEFHVLQKSSYVRVVDPKLAPVAAGERGRVLVGRIASKLPSGSIVPSYSSGLLNYLNGDEATLISERCECGSIIPRLVSIRRVDDVEEKLTSGCQML